jgi:hypothetical protein
VDFAIVAKLSTHQLEHLIVRLQFGYNFGPFSHIRVGPDGRLYYLQTSAKWGMRVARYRWPG